MSETVSETLVTEDMVERKGVWVNPRTSPPVSESDIRKWAIATYWPEAPPKIYWDAEYASTTTHRGIIAPPDFNPFAWPVRRTRLGGATRRAAGSAPTVDGKPVKRTTGMNGGQTDTYGVSMRPGDVVSSRSRLVKWEERQGRLGLTLYTYTETEWTNQDGALVRRRISTGIRY